MEYKFADKIQPQQLELITNFINSLKGDDFDLFWSTLSNIDKAYIKGTHNALIVEGENYSYDEFKQTIFCKIKEKYLEYIDNYVISTIVRYYSKLKGSIFLKHGVKVPIYYIVDSDISMINIPIILELQLSEHDDLLPEWKINILSQ